MNKTILVLLLSIGVLSCKSSEKRVDKLGIAKQFYKILDNSKASEIKNLLTDSLITKETQYNYVQIFSLEEYIEWLKWDSVFNPTYRILKIEHNKGIVKAKVSKIDKRILFLHEEPIITNQVIKFDNNKIISLETTEYLVFNDSTFVKNRAKFLNWIDQNHPELNGFIYDQTKIGAIKYLKVIELYQNRK